MKSRNVIAIAVVIAANLAVSLQAQAPAIKRTILQRADVADGKEAILGLAEIAPGGSTGKHTHFGIETGYVLEGGAVMEIEGQPPRTLKAGDSYMIPAGKVHDARTDGAVATKVLATYVVEKGKPLATPAP